MALRLAAAARIEQIIAAIRRMLDADVAIASWRPLAGGTDGRSFAIEVAGRRIVAKLTEPDTPTALGVEAELRLLEHASSIGVAPRPIGVDAEIGLLLCEFVASLPWAPEQLHASGSIERIAGRLRLLHTLPAGVRPYEPLRFAEIYVGLCVAADRGRANAAYAELAEQVSLVGGGRAELVVCHNDLHVSNILLATEILFIDFEYAVTAPPIIDLASMIAMNAFDARQTERLLEAYYRPGPVPFSEAALAAAVRTQQLLAELWHLARAGRATRVGRGSRSGGIRE